MYTQVKTKAAVVCTRLHTRPEEEAWSASEPGTGVFTWISDKIRWICDLMMTIMDSHELLLCALVNLVPGKTRQSNNLRAWT